MRVQKVIAVAMQIGLLAGVCTAFAKPSNDAKEESIAMTVQHALKKQKKIKAPLVEQYLIDGRLADGNAAMQEHLKAHPSDESARFGLGMLQFIQAIEHLSQDLFRYGLRNPDRHGLPILRLSVPENPNPKTLSYEQARQIIDEFRKNLLEAEATMAPISDPDIKLPIRFGLIKLDLNGDGNAGDNETLWKLYSKISRNTGVDEEKAKAFSITFDRGDVHWLRGYCHLLSSICEIYLAHDSRETFECTGHLFFSKVESPYKFLAKGKHVRRLGSSEIEILDLIALIHLISWNVVEPQRMEAALHHLEAVVAQSRESWKFILAETDDDNEWLPNPNQTGVIPNVKVTREMIDKWQDGMTEIEQLLSGKLLIPFWREENGRGINVRKVFLQPHKLDLVLWVQGPAAAPFLEDGPKTKASTWRQVQEPFGNNFPGFAFWFN